MFCLLKFKKIAHYRGLEHDVAGGRGNFFFFCFMSTAIIHIYIYIRVLKTYLRRYNKLQSAHYNFF